MTTPIQRPQARCDTRRGRRGGGVRAQSAGARVAAAAPPVATQQVVRARRASLAAALSFSTDVQTSLAA